MSPQKEGESLEMYMYRLELTQEGQEREIEKTKKDVETALSVATEAREMAVQTNSMVGDMPKKVIEAIDERERLRKKEQKMDGRERLFLAMGIIGTIGGLAGTLVSIKQAFGG